ncbi:helix-turn-helix domain-containing protein [Paenibacillus alvei]|uniref:helix-turn-helix domain-containing protein n=1 Tax=Paenibacillus alvei TaxID=44250 RepID=UPI0013DCBAA2|nr:helix-turn-helix transcriptional regulator [Paenibacillus alvei]NEZ45406.1 helix-turn-helix domain-containing protein [Paenibacillus alvei]
MESTLIQKTIGELILDTRRASNMSITQLSDLSGVNRGAISRLENNDVKRPEFAAIYALSVALQIPFDTIVHYYVDTEKRSDVLLHILSVSIQQNSDIDLIRKVATKYLEAPNEDSFDLTEKLYQHIDSIEDTSVKLSIYNLIVEYSRSHGIMPYIAKGLYQQYLIERYDLNRLKDTYYNGKYIINYADFLSQQEQIELYYKLAIQAYNLKFYHESIEHCKKLLTLNSAESPHRVNALWILRDANFALGKYEESELYSLQYKQFNYPNSQEHTVFMEALYNSVKGNTDKAINELRAFLETCSDTFILGATRHLLQLYLKVKNFAEARALIENSRVNSSILDEGNPLTYYGYGEYQRILGEYFSSIGEIDNSINHLVKGLMCFSKIKDIIKEKECLNTIIHIHIKNNIPMTGQILEDLGNYLMKED